MYNNFIETHVVDWGSHFYTHTHTQTDTHTDRQTHTLIMNYKSRKNK